MAVARPHPVAHPDPRARVWLVALVAASPRPPWARAARPSGRRGPARARVLPRGDPRRLRGRRLHRHPRAGDPAPAGSAPRAAPRAVPCDRRRGRHPGARASAGSCSRVPASSTDDRDTGIPAYMVQASLLGPAHGILVIRGSVDEGLTYAVRRGDGVTIGEDEILAARRADAEFDARRAGADLASTRRRRGAAGRAGIQYVVLPAPADGTVAAGLDASGGLDQPVPRTAPRAPGGSAVRSTRRPRRADVVAAHRAAGAAGRWRSCWCWCCARRARARGGGVVSRQNPRGRGSRCRPWSGWPAGCG